MSDILVSDSTGRIFRSVPFAEAKREIAAGQAVQCGKGKLRVIQLTGHGESHPAPWSTVYAESITSRAYRMVLKTEDGVMAI